MKKLKSINYLKHNEINGIQLIKGGVDIFSVMMTVHVTNCGQENEDAEYDED